MAITEVEKDGKKQLQYRFQPTLEDGTPIGGEQVVYGETHDELMDKAAENYQHLYRKNRELLRAEKLGGKAPDGAQPAAPAVTFKPRPLTAEERMQLARDLNNPEKIDSALDLALEAKFGAKPQAVSESVNSNASRAASLHAAQQAEAWRDSHPEFHASPKNVRDIATWIQNRNLEFTVENFDKAYEDLLPALEVAPPSPVRTTPTPESATPDSRIAVAGGGTGQRQTEVPPVPTTVSRKTGTTKVTPKKEGMTADQFRKLTNDERRKFLREHPDGF